jgi:hypothetical protein
MAAYLTADELCSVRSVNRAWHASARGLARSLAALTYRDVAAHAAAGSPLPLQAPRAMRGLERLDLRDYSATCYRWEGRQRADSGAASRRASGCPTAGYASAGSEQGAWLASLAADPAAASRLRKLALGADVPRPLARGLLRGAHNLRSLSLAGMERATDEVRRRRGVADIGGRGAWVADIAAACSPCHASITRAPFPRFRRSCSPSCACHTCAAWM